jgi:hypothetical protein
MRFSLRDAVTTGVISARNKFSGSTELSIFPQSEIAAACFRNLWLNGKNLTGENCELITGRFINAPVAVSKFGKFGVPSFS